MNKKSKRQKRREAFRHHIKSAKQGNADAQITLTSHYYADIGVKQDFKRAFHWYRLAAKQGSLMLKGF